MAYAQIKDGKLVKVVDNLPKNYEDVSGFDKASDVVLESKGWLPVVREKLPSLKLDQRYGDEIINIDKSIVTISREVVTMDLEECKQWLINRGESVARRLLRESYDLQTQILALSGVLGDPFKQLVIDKMSSTVGKFLVFKSEVTGATNKAELLTIYNKYPQLR